MSAETDRALLRRFEPVMRYTRGEQFFPMDVEPYVHACSLWMQPPGEDPLCLIPEGELTLDKLAQPRASGFGTVYFLKFIAPLDIRKFAAYNLQRIVKGFTKKDSQDVFRAGRGRLARVRLPLALCRCAVLTYLAGARPRARRHGRGSHPRIPTHPRREGTPLLLRSRRATERLDRVAVLVLLPFQ